MYTPQPKDFELTTIQGSIGQIPFIRNFTVTSGNWVAITPLGETKKVIIQPRTEITWYIATASGSGEYFTCRNGAAIQMPIVVGSGTVILWASANQTTTIELLYGA